MAEQHVYMSVGKRQRDANGHFTGPYIANGKINNSMNYRGLAGENDDPPAFKRLMEARGHAVHIAEKFLGLNIAVGG